MATCHPVADASIQKSEAKIKRGRPHDARVNFILRLVGVKFMALKKFLMVGIMAAVLVACAGTRNSETSSSSVTPQSSESETSVSSNSSAKSSSSAASSSSVPEGYVDPSTVVKGTLTDERDGKTYKTVKIGTQTWMAENLNFKTERRWCYAGEDSICNEYGGLYTWEEAKESCPAGWHLPSKKEFESLFKTVGGDSIAGEKLKFTDDWLFGSGSDAYMFSALAAGMRSVDGSYVDGGYSTLFWSSSEYSDGDAYYVYLSFKYDSARLRHGLIYYGFSVRCVKDENPSGSTPKSNSSETSGPNNSSLVGKKTCDVNTDENCFKDERDGQAYKTVKIGSQTWMAENLNHETENSEVENSSCYKDSEENCAKYGRLYSWPAAIKACPSGWHLPTKAEFETLITVVGDTSTAGLKLKSTTGWSSRNGADALGFSALSAGYGETRWFYHGEGDYANFWSSTENIDVYVYAYALFLYGDGDNAHLGYTTALSRFSVRCVKDE